MSFESRIEEMNLTNIGNGRYFYGDRFGQIIYSKIQTFSSINMVGSNETLPMIAIYTRRSTNDNYLFCGIVSNSYKFYGNARLNQEVLNSINSAGQPVLRENTIQSKKLTEFRNEIIIRNAKNIREIGNVYPIIIIENSYAGTKAARFIFGFGILENNIVRCIPFRSMGTIKQVHLQNSMINFESAVGSYLTVFSTNIVELIHSNFHNVIDETTMLSVLDLVSDVGKKKRDAISRLLDDIVGNTDYARTITTWNLFLAILRFTSLEQNINAKRLIENIAERVLFVPQRMMNAVKTLTDI